MIYSLDTILSAFDSDSQHAFKVNGEKKIFNKGEFIYRQGEEGNSIYYIASGTVHVTVIDRENATKQKFINEISTGGLFGEYSALSEKPRASNIVAVKRCETYALSRDAFLELVTRTSDVAKKTISYMAYVLRLEQINRINLLTMDAKERLISYMMLRMEMEQSKDITLPKIQDLAAELNMKRETLSRRLAILEKEGLIQRKNKKVSLVKIDEMSKILK